MITANAALALISALSLLFTYAMILLYKRAVERRERYRFACDAARDKLIQVALPLALWLSKRDIDKLWTDRRGRWLRAGPSSCAGACRSGARRRTRDGRPAYAKCHGPSRACL